MAITIERKNIWPIINFIVLPLVLITGTFGYFQVEAATAAFSDDLIGAQESCSRVSDSLKYYKVIYYHASRGEAKIYCIYDNSKENREITLNRRDENSVWEVVVVNHLNTNRSLYWPVYN